MTTENDKGGIDDRTWELLMARFDKLDERVDVGFKTMNGRVRFTEKMLWTTFGGLGVVSVVITVIARMMKV